MSSSESDDENMRRIHSAIDHDFINDILTQGSCGDQKLLPSLRPRKVKLHSNELNVTPGFQSHVAKHLDAIIEKKIKEIGGTNGAAVKTVKESESGIKLFSCSKVRITKRDLEIEVEKQNSPRKRRKNKPKNSSSGDDSYDELDRLSSVAVSPEWVLQKKGAYGKCEKGKVIRLKDAGNGRLIEVPSTE